MFNGIGQFASMLKQTREIQTRVQEFQEQLGRLKVTGAAGGGMVTIEMNGDQQVLSCHIEESLLQSGDRELLEDLIVTAVNQARDRAKDASLEQLNKMAGGVDVSSMLGAISKLQPGG